MTVISNPTPPFSNPPINPQYYVPQRFLIANLTLGINTVVTTSVAHDYVIGQQIRLLIPSFYGSFQLNEQEGMVISIPSPTQVLVNIDSSRNVNAFIPSPSYTLNAAQIIAVGDFNSGQINTGRNNNLTFIPGSFRNIS